MPTCSGEAGGHVDGQVQLLLQLQQGDVVVLKEVSDGRRGSGYSAIRKLGENHVGIRGKSLKFLPILRRVWHLKRQLKD